MFKFTKGKELKELKKLFEDGKIKNIKLKNGDIRHIKEVRGWVKVSTPKWHSHNKDYHYGWHDSDGINWGETANFIDKPPIVRIDTFVKFRNFLIDSDLYYKPGGWSLCSKEENRKFSIKQAEDKYNVDLQILKDGE